MIFEQRVGFFEKFRVFEKLGVFEKLVSENGQGFEKTEVSVERRGFEKKQWFLKRTGFFGKGRGFWKRTRFLKMVSLC